MKIRLHLKIFIFIIIFIITKQIEIYGIMMLFALIHELGHILMGIILGFKPTKLEILPYGISVEFDSKLTDYNTKIEKANLLSLKKIAIALAGPITNIILIIISLIFNLKFFGIEIENVIYANIIIAIFNLLPIYPLDGGRIIKNIINIKLGLKESYKYTAIISKITMCILTAIASIAILYIRNIAILIIILYLWYLLIREKRILLLKYNLYERIEQNINKNINQNIN